MRDRRAVSVRTQPRYGHGSTKCCSGECHARMVRQAKKEAERKRRAIKRGAKHEPYRSREIFERDAWRCQLCRKRVCRGLVAPNPKAPTIDHILPLSRGGGDVPGNVQCAHFICNSRKNDALGFQARLFG